MYLPNTEKGGTMPNPNGRPKVKNPNNIVKTIRLNEEMINKIESYAKENNLTFGAAIKIALEQFFK